MSKKTKLESLTQTHGKTETYRPSTLEQILGDTGTTKYGTMDAAVYEKQITNMPKTDLQAHATKVGLVPIDDRERMIKRLMHEFNLHVASYRHPGAKNKAPTGEPNDEVLSILARGR